MPLYTVKYTQKKDIIFKGNLVKHENGRVVLVTKESGNRGFCGVIVKRGIIDCEEGVYANNWYRDEYVQFKGTITIEALSDAYYY